MKDRIARRAARMLEELDSGYLEVCKVPGRQGGYVRVVCNCNAEWYRVFCRRFERGRRRYRKPRTIIRRCHTRKALLHLAAGKNGTVYSGRLVEFMERWYEDIGTGPRD